MWESIKEGFETVFYLLVALLAGVLGVAAVGFLFLVTGVAFLPAALLAIIAALFGKKIIQVNLKLPESKQDNSSKFEATRE